MTTPKLHWARNDAGLIALQAALAFVASAAGFLIVYGAYGLSRTLDIFALTASLFLALLCCRAVEPSGEIRIKTREIGAALLAGVLGGTLGIGVGYLLPVAIRLEAAPAFVSATLLALFAILVRLGQSELGRIQSTRRPGAKPTIVVGSGEAAASLVRLIQENENFKYRVVGCVDDDALATRVADKPILGGIEDLPRLIRKYGITSVIIAIPSAAPSLVSRIMAQCTEGVGGRARSPIVKILPGVLELLSDGARLSRIRQVQPEDLLPRAPAHVDIAEIAPHVENRVILVTGAGGSIGSELCRQIVGLQPSLLLLLGHGENSLFAIDEELKLRFGFHRTRIVLADVADEARIRSVFSKHRPHVVFHAAAHKHVPIVEANMCEAVRNNVLGTHVVALAAAAADAAKFVLLSTDKAVNPTSVMGVTKRLSEIISQSFVNQTSTEFVTVRFGNVLESRGSVIPVFKRQIERGGPVTITHRDMQRYFMTIPEAVSLVLQAMAIGRDGQVLVLDMGEPVNILTLAETLIRLSGLTPHHDIEILETGIRPGEKLFEEILTTHEGMSTTSHARVFIAQQERVAYDTLALGLRALKSATKAGDERAVVDVLRNFVPSYQPWVQTAEASTNGKVPHAPAVHNGVLPHPRSNGHVSDEPASGLLVDGTKTARIATP